MGFVSLGEAKIKSAFNAFIIVIKVLADKKLIYLRLIVMCRTDKKSKESPIFGESPFPSE